MTSAKYAEVNALEAGRQYLEYTDLGKNALTFSDGDVGHAYVFEARYNEKTPRARFIQTAKVCGTHVYLIHMTLALGTDTALYIPVFSSFHCGG
jgi:Zn/Cd-binding protein ZinT